MAATKVETLTTPRDSLPNVYTSVTARELDFVTRFADNWTALREIYGIMRPIRKQAGTSLVSYTASVALESGAVPAGAVIPYTCCCETREAIQGVNYNMATQGCETRQAISTGTRDIIENQNGNTRAILDALTAQRIEAKDAKIAEQNQQLFAAQLAASQAAQNETLKAYMSGQLAYYNPRPVPSFQVPAPYQYGNCGTGCGGCGC